MGFADVLGTTKKTGFGSVLGGTTFGGGFAPKPDVSTIKGLEQVAKKEGLGERATEILAEKGEKPKEIYSGGFVMDIFDTLNALQYGVTGVLKGKSFSEGVKTRQSFSDKDAVGDYGLPGVIGGIALDIAVDPLTYVPVLGVGKAALKGIKGVSQAVGKAAVKAPVIGGAAEKVGNTLGRSFIYRFGQDPIYKEVAERSIKNIAVGNQNLLEIARPLTKLDASTQKAIAEARKAGELIPEVVKPIKKIEGIDEIKRVANNLLKNNPGITQRDAEAMARDIIENRKFKAVKGIKEIPKEIKELEPLAQEARKYKSAEEFITSQQKAFHGSPIRGLEEIGFGEGIRSNTFLGTTKKVKSGAIFFSPNEKTAKYFADNRIEWLKDLGQKGEASVYERYLNIKNPADLIDIKKAEKILDDLGISVEKEILGTIPEYGLGASLEDLVKGGHIEMSELWKLFDDKNIISKFQKAGFDGALLKETKELGTSYAIFNPKQAFTKSQLTDFYNQAVRGVEEIPKITKGLTPEVLAKAKPAFDELDRLGKEAVEVGLLKAETYAENVGSYIARLYRKHEIPKGVVEKVKTFFEKKPVRIDVSRFKKRTDIPEDVREAMGEILEAGYPTAKGLVQLNQAVERAKFFKEVAGTWAKDTIEEGFSKLPDVKTLGELAGKAVPTPIFDDIQEIIRIKTPTEKVLNKIVGGFKFSKVILNPATHARNIMSNFLLNSFEGLSPARLDIYARAAKQLATKGDLYQEARKVGLGLDTFASRELKDILLGPEAQPLVKKFGRKFIETLSNLYQKEEEFAKMAQYIFQRGKGLSPDDAYKIAERATFNYAQVTPFIRRLRESIWGFPFITFCVSPDTEILTDKGWKTFDFIDIKNDLTLAYDIKTKELKWQKIEEVFVFPYSGKMISIKGRSLDILMTPNHRNVIERTLHRRKIGNKNEIQIIEANNLTKADKIIVAGNYIAPKEKTISDEMVELVGWFITEGYLVKEHNAMFIGQTNLFGQEKIEKLRRKLGIEKFNIQIRKYKLGGYKPHKIYYFPAKIRDEVLKLAPNKELKIEFLKKLTKEQLELLYQVILLADGHNPKNKKSNQVIIQNKGETANSIQILGVMLGKQFGWTKHDNALGITITKGYKRQLKRNMPTKIDYNGIVWCPKTELGTWIARRNGKVFITGNTYKATPQVMRTLITKPTKISNIGKIKTAIENQADLKELERERASEPEWIREGFYVKMPIKDKFSRSAYLDLSYILPFGDLITGNYLERDISRETGLPESPAEAAIKKMPFINLIRELAKNQDFYGNKIVKEGDTIDSQLGDIFRHIVKLYAPPAISEQIPGGYRAGGERRPGMISRVVELEKKGIEAGGAQTRTLAQELLRQVGLKISPVDVKLQESFMESEKKKALRTLLGEVGAVKEFKKTYIPK